MPRYVIVSKLTDEGAKKLKNDPNRLKKVNSELEGMGVKVLEQYVVLGSFDFLNIVEADDNLTVAKAVLDRVSRGSVRTRTYPIIPVDEFLEKL